MGVYLNSRKPCSLYEIEVNGQYFVDKTPMLEELMPLVKQGGKYTCITRPRRFGKTVMASMIGAFFGKGKECRELFAGLKIGSCSEFEKHMNQHNVIYIPFNEAPKECQS